MLLRPILPFIFAVAVGSSTVVPAEPHQGDATEMVSLTDEEQAWIAAHPIIRVGHDPSYSPYALQNASGQIVGIDPDYLEAISHRTGLKFENSIRRDWGEVLRDFKNGDLDLLLSLNHALEREAYLIYTQPYASAYNVIITRSDTPILSALNELQGHTIAVPRGDTTLRANLERVIPGLMTIEYDDAAECYLAVARGEVYATVGDVANAAYYIRTHRVINLRFGNVVSASSAIYIGVRKDWPILADIINKALATLSAEERQQISDRWIAADSSVYRWWARAFRIAAVAGSVCFVVFLLLFFHNRRLARELAERRRIQAELEQTTIRLREASQEKSELMHMVAHDLRSPLGAIQIGLELLQLSPPLAEPARSLTARRVNESADMMSRLINDMLSAQNVEEGRFSLKFVQDDAVQLARTAVSALSTVAQHKRITIEADLPEEPIGLTTDFVALQQVVDNLLSNALKYSPPGARVEIALKADSIRCRIEVRDQGPGVMPDEREKIFEKFKRGSAQPTQGEKSTGLGLWIVRRFVAALYGRVWCEPGPGGIGSNFIVEVPMAPPAQ